MAHYSSGSAGLFGVGLVYLSKPDMIWRFGTSPLRHNVISCIEIEK